MAHRINTGNFDNGMDSRLGQVDWRKTFDRHWQFASKAEMLEAYGHIPKAKKEIERRFRPFLLGEHLYLNLECGQKQICIGYIDEYEKGRFMISLNSDFGEDSEVIKGKKNAIERLYEIYQQATEAAVKEQIEKAVQWSNYYSASEYLKKLQILFVAFQSKHNALVDNQEIEQDAFLERQALYRNAMDRIRSLRGSWGLRMLQGS